jgi:thioredoxin reductase
MILAAVAIVVAAAVVAKLIRSLRGPRPDAGRNTVVKLASRPTRLVARYRYQAGQVWTYRNRPGEKASRLTILKVDPSGNGNIVHVHVSRVVIENSAAPHGKSTFITHMPFTEEAIDQSVLQLVDQTEQLPPFEEGYATWKEQADKNNAGVFAIGVAKAIDGIATAFKGDRRAAERL